MMTMPNPVKRAEGLAELALRFVAADGPGQAVEQGQHREGLKVGEPEATLDRGIRERAVVDPVHDHLRVFGLHHEVGVVGHGVAHLELTTFLDLETEGTSVGLDANGALVVTDVLLGPGALGDHLSQPHQSVPGLVVCLVHALVELDLRRLGIREVQVRSQQHGLVQEICGYLGLGHPEHVRDAAFTVVLEHQYQGDALDEDAGSGQTRGGAQLRRHERGLLGFHGHVHVASAIGRFAVLVGRREDGDGSGGRQDATMGQFQGRHLLEFAVRAVEGRGRHQHHATLGAEGADELAVEEGLEEGRELAVGLVVERDHAGGELQAGHVVQADHRPYDAFQVEAVRDDHQRCLHAATSSPSSRTTAPP